MNKHYLVDKFNAIAAKVPAPFYCLDLEQHYIGINPSGLVELGLVGHKEDLSTKTPYDIYPGPVADQLVKYHQEVVRTGKALALNKYMGDVYGENQPYSLTIKPLYDDKNTIVGTSAISIRLASNKVLNLPTKASSNKGLSNNLEEGLKKLANTIPIPFYWLDLNQRYLDINPTGLEVLSDLTSKEDIKGKTLYNFYSKELADALVVQHQQVIKTNKKFIKEITVKDEKDGSKETKCFTSTVWPLKDDEGNIVGSYGTLVENIAEKQSRSFETNKQVKNSEMLRQIEQIANTLPIIFYWGDSNVRILGFNKIAAKAIGFESEHSIRGKTLYDLYPYEMAHNIILNHRKVFQTNKTAFKKEAIKNRKTGKTKYFNAVIAPWYDNDGHTMGTYGFSIDITAQKEAKLRKEAQQERFSRIISQAAHDIRSPLAGMLMIVKSSSTLPLDIRLALKESANSINDIAENLLQNWRVTKDREIISEDKQAEPLLVSLLMMQVIASKRFQFQGSSIKFKLVIDEDSYFGCIQANASRFKRSLSNLINNAVASYENQVGEVTCQLRIEKDHMVVTVEDQGKGITTEVLEKINQGIQVTHGKEGGQGIGLTQVRDTLELFKGKMQIDSNLGQGTQVQLSFPISDLAPWLADSIKLKNEDVLVIVDDDDSMQQAWQAFFKQRNYGTYLSQNSKQFTEGKEAIRYINGLVNKDQVVLLTDYELLNQPVDGIDIIKQTGIKRTIVVTSHYDDKPLRQYVNESGIKILPKPLVHQVPLTVY